MGPAEPVRQAVAGSTVAVRTVAGLTGDLAVPLARPDHGEQQSQRGDDREGDHAPHRDRTHHRTPHGFRGRQ